MDVDGTEMILNILRKYLEPEAGDSVYQEVARFSQFERADQTRNVFLVESDCLCRKAESTKQMGGLLPPPRSICFCDAHAERRRIATWKSLVSASVQGNLGYPAAAKQTRRLFGPCSGAARQGVLVAAYMGAFSGEATDIEAWVADRKAKKTGGKKEGGWRCKEKGK